MIKLLPTDQQRLLQYHLLSTKLSNIPQFYTEFGNNQLVIVHLKHGSVYPQHKTPKYKQLIVTLNLTSYHLPSVRLAAIRRFTVVSRIVTFPDGFFPERRFPERRFPDGHFPGKTFPGWSFSQMRQFLMINLQAHT